VCGRRTFGTFTKASNVEGASSEPLGPTQIMRKPSYESLFLNRGSVLRETTSGFVLYSPQ